MSLKTTFDTKIRKTLQKDLGLSNPLAVPALSKIIVSIGTGSHQEEKDFQESAARDLAAITGQKPVLNLAKKSVAGFKIRKGQTVGLMVTLRGPRMWDFFEKLVSFNFPRSRDFKGISRQSLDGRGNISLGISEHTIFPEIDSNKVDKIKSLGVVITTTARSDEEGYQLLKALGFPFRES